MNSTTQQESGSPAIERAQVQTQVADELRRVKIFLGIQAFFLVVSVFTGGFNFKLWCCEDKAPEGRRTPRRFARKRNAANSARFLSAPAFWRFGCSVRETGDQRFRFCFSAARR